MTDEELIEIDERLCNEGLFAPLPGRVNGQAVPLKYVSQDGSIRLDISSQGTEARLYSKRHPDGVGERATGDAAIRRLVAKAIDLAKRKSSP